MTTPLPDAGLPRLLAIMERLRDPEHGCPWDVAQTFATIAPYTIEEAHEVADAIARGAHDELRVELGDLLFQVVFHARMAQEAGQFAFDDVVTAISDKMVARHPHVFDPDAPRLDPEAQRRDWEQRKAAERAQDGAASVLDGVALALPALSRALKLQARAARVGFDWPSTDEVLDKLREEAAELVQARAQGDGAAIEDEFGDLLFVVVNLGRHLGLDPESALRGANRKFVRRFRHIEAALAAEGRGPRDSSLAEMEALWQAAKAQERDAPA